MRFSRGIASSSVLEFPVDRMVHPEAEIEWWYQFAFLNERYTLVSCFWRYHPLDLPQGLMACYALTEMRGEERWRNTWIDPSMLHLSREILSRSPHLDLFNQGAMELTKDGQSFSPYTLAREARISSGPEDLLDATLGPYSARYNAGRDELRLRIDEPGLHLDLTFGCDGVSFPMNAAGSFDLVGKHHSGYSFPQAPVTGSMEVGGRRQPVQGKAWLDHQWGGWTFDQEQFDSGFAHPEWHYFAIPFDDGNSLVVSLTKPDGKLVNGCWSGADGNLRRIENVRVTARDQLSSLRTRNVYDYGWTLEVPELDAKLELTPFHPNHEVLTFTRERGFLEVGVDVTGTLQGSPCRSLGFVETFGKTVDLHEGFWSVRPQGTLRQIAKFLPRKATPDWLQKLTGAGHAVAIDPQTADRALLDPIWSMLDRGGKAWRSAWFVLCCHALGYEGSDQRLRELLPVVELMHTGSLIIDDIQDESLLRRGEPALHRQIGTDLAINVGNFLYFLPLILIQDLTWMTDGQRLDTYQAIALGQRQGHIGQALDLMWSKGRYSIPAKLENFARTRDELLEQYRLKCGCQLEAASRIAGTLTGATECQIAALNEYSQMFGMVYQIIDDVKDATSDQKTLGKRTGEDLRNGRLNFVLLYALACAPPAFQRRIAGAMAAGQGETYAAEVHQQIVRSESVPKCLEWAETMIEGAFGRLEPLPPSDARIGLWSIPQLLVKEYAGKRF